MKCNYCYWFSSTYCSCPFYDKKEFCNRAELKEENENLILADIEEVLQDKIKENMENDSRVVKVTLQQAKEWYYSGK